ncbi:hypothetical protein [Roseimaritima multifibrata]|uniref:hypothetical protein n=1 Tax=Roseimaritima multifibrata TaxID=1930274 RepID=UPI001C54D42B|nr:hypothetical protein [Roseimaritima multifibrata]
MFRISECRDYLAGTIRPGKQDLQPVDVKSCGRGNVLAGGVAEGKGISASDSLS